MTWVEVADTAIKIGLGAIITAISGFVLIWKTQSHEIKKERWKRTQNTLEDISREFEEVHNHLVDRATTNFHISKVIESINETLKKNSKDVNEEIDKALRQTKADFLRLYALEGKLLLLSGREEEQLLRDYRVTATKIEDVPIYSEDAVEKLRPTIDELHQKRMIFYESISSLYKKP